MTTGWQALIAISKNRVANLDFKMSHIAMFLPAGFKKWDGDKRVGLLHVVLYIGDFKREPGGGGAQAPLLKIKLLEILMKC